MMSKIEEIHTICSHDRGKAADYLKVFIGV